ncbi:hypothetical protein PQX77_000974 [Marasmius sp. AFHP31]|nr:hypothetical protein PQX77_000974 [Marasmius sp. AFHP31]
MPVLSTAEAISTVDNTQGGIPTKLFVTGAILLVTIVGIKKWFYPYTLEDDLKRQIFYIGEVIEENTTLGRDLLGDLGWRFRERLAGEHLKMIEIQEWVTAEPKRWNLIGWIRFRWREMGEVKRCYYSVMDLKKDIMVRPSTLAILEYQQLTVNDDQYR